MTKDSMVSLIIKLKTETAMMQKKIEDQTRIIRAQNLDIRTMEFRIGTKDLKNMSLQHQITMLKSALESYKVAFCDDGDDWTPIVPSNLKQYGESIIKREGGEWYA